MGSFLNTVFSILLGWIKGLVSMIWSAFNGQEGESILQFIGKNWIVITAIICGVGLIADFLVYLFRWEPYKVWKTFWRKLRKKNSEVIPEEASEYFAEGSRETEHAVPEFFDETETEAFQEEYEGSYVSQENEEYNSAYNEEYGEQISQEDELYRWREKPDIPESSEIPVHTVPEVTRAGYVVPAGRPQLQNTIRRSILTALSPDAAGASAVCSETAEMKKNTGISHQNPLWISGMLTALRYILKSGTKAGIRDDDGSF